MVEVEIATGNGKYKHNQNLWCVQSALCTHGCSSSIEVDNYKDFVPRINLQKDLVVVQPCRGRADQQLCNLLQSAPYILL